MKKFTKVLLAAGALAVSALSHAAPVIDWDVTATGSWTLAAPGTVTNNGTTLSWGTGSSGPSSLVITNPATTNIPTWYGTGAVPAGFIAPSITLTHNNNIINAGSSLTGATLTVAVTLKPNNPLDNAFALPTIDYKIKFVETTNAPPCAATSPAGNPCNDIFVLIDGFLNETISYGGQDYFVNAFPTSGGVLSTLSNSACAAALSPNGCFGFTTEEGRNTKLAFGLTISSERLVQQVPEPGSLALIGLALAGLGFATRRRSSAA